MMRTYDGRKKRQRFNEDVGEAIVEAKQIQNENNKKFNQTNLGRFGVNRRASNDEIDSKLSKRSQLKSQLTNNLGSRKGS